MLRFAHPEYFNLLWLLPFLLLFVYWSARQRRRQLAKIGDLSLINRLTKSVSYRKRNWKTALFLFSFCFLVIALTDPQIGSKLQEVKREGLDVFIALDVSNSMLAEDVPPNRFERAKQEISNFIDELRGDRVGLILFSGLAFVQCPLTLDYSAAKLFLDESRVGIIPQPGTAISEAIKAAQQSFVSQEQKYKVLIVITDGESHEDNPVEAAKEIAKTGVVVYTVGVGSPSGAPIPEYDQSGRRVGYKKDRNGQTVTTRLDVVTLQKIAEATGGKFVSMGFGGGLQEVLDDIMKMEKKELSAREFTQFEDRFQIFLLLALLLLIAEFLIDERKSSARLKSVLTKSQTERSV